MALSPAERSALLGLRHIVRKNEAAVACIDLLLSSPERSANALRQAKHRQKKKDAVTGNVTTNVTRNATSNVTRNGTSNVTGDVTGGYGGVSVSDSFSLSPSESLESTRATPDPMASDGSFGLTSGAWAEGIRLATGKPCTPPRGAGLRVFQDAVKAHRPRTEDAIEWVRKSARAYAEKRLGRADAANVFKWVEWLNAGQPEPFNGPTTKPGGKLVQAEPAEGPAWKMGGGNV